MHIELLGGLEVLDDQSGLWWWPERSSGPSWPCWPCTRVEWSQRSFSSTRFGVQDPPAGVRNGLQGLASKLRRALGSADLVAMRGDIDPMSDLQVAAAVCFTVLAAIAVEGDEPKRAASLLGQADRLRSDAGADIPAFQHDDVERAQEAAAALGPAVFLAAFERGQTEDAVLSRP